MKFISLHHYDNITGNIGDIAINNEFYGGINLIIIFILCSMSCIIIKLLKIRL